MLQAVWEERKQPGLNCMQMCAHSPQKTWESVYVCKQSVKLIHIHLVHFCIIERQQLRKRFLVHVGYLEVAVNYA